MKTTILKRSFNITMVCIIIITTIVIIENMMHHVNYLYSVQPIGSGTTCFFDAFL